MESLFIDLHKLGVRITGSYACGKQHDNSDIDIYVPLGKFKRLKKILERHGIKWGSITIGEIHTLPNETPIPLEFASWFDKRKDRLPNVVLFGLRFKTR